MTDQKKREGEFLYSITTTDGRKLDIHMPTMGELEYLLDGTGPTCTLYRMCAIAAGISYAEFQALGLVDGQKIMSKLQASMATIGTMFKQGN